MIKVENTKIHQITIIPKQLGKFVQSKIGVLVTDAELVLVHLEKAKSILGQLAFTSYADGSSGLTIADSKDVVIDEFSNKLHSYLVKPILISRTEKIEVGDWFYSEDSKQIFQHKKGNGFIINHKCFKILALPEHFSTQQLQHIVDGKLKEGDVRYIECEKVNGKREYTDTLDIVGNPTYFNIIKLNPHITIHTIEEKTYTKKELIKWANKNVYSWGIFNGNKALDYDSFVNYLNKT